MLLLLIPKFDCPLLIVIGIRSAPFDLDQPARARSDGLLQRILRACSHITSIREVLGMAAIEGVTGPPCEIGRPTMRSARSWGVADLSIEARRGLRHHRGAAKE